MKNNRFVIEMEWACELVNKSWIFELPGNIFYDNETYA